jgi:hypothetical protein
MPVSWHPRQLASCKKLPSALSPENCLSDTACNAFTYNQLKSICFLKSAAAQWTIITLGAITGIRLSPFSFEGETKKQDQSGEKQQ